MVTADSNTNREVIRVRGLHNRFGDQVIHENLNLDVRRREILGVVGGSGTGKSVLLRSIVGLHNPNQGNIELFGKELNKLNTSQRSALEMRLGVLFQGGALFTSLTVLENVALPLIEHFRLSRKDAETLARTKLGLVGLRGEALHKYPAMLSGGMVKRAALARALVLDPEILFLDEPTAGLDPIGAAAFDRLIVTLRNALGFTVFLVTHDLDTLYASCDRVAVLADRQVLITDQISVVESADNEWIKAYFQGPRGRNVRSAIASNERNV